MLLIKAAKFINCIDILFIISYVELILSEPLLSLSTFLPIGVCDTLIKLYICNDKIIRESQLL